VLGMKLKGTFCSPGSSVSVVEKVKEKEVFVPKKIKGPKNENLR